jgi:DNA-binding NarL/FixJ family response regulator
MRNQTIQLLLVEDHAMVRKGIKALFSEYEGICVIGEAANGMQGIQLTNELRPDVVLIDLSMPDMDGIEAIRRIIAVRPEQRILVLTAFEKEEKIMEAIRAGAMGYLFKTCSPDELVQSIRTVHEGAPVLDNKVLWRLLSQKTGAGMEERVRDLTRREMDVLRLLAAGYTDDEIAKKLWLTNVTIRTHIGRTLSKLGAQNRVQAVLYGLRLGLVSLEETGSLNEACY